MSTYTQIIYQVVFSTKHRQMTLTADKRDDLYKYISGVLQNKKCHLYRIGGVEDHIHILFHLHPTVALSTLVKDIKMASSDYIKRNKIFLSFNGWQEGYGAFTYSIKEKDILIEYIKNQEAHHHKHTFMGEYLQLLSDNQINYDEKYVF